MYTRHLAIPTVIGVGILILCLCSRPSLAATNPVKPVAKPQTALPASAVSAQLPVCGTYKGNERESLARFQLHQAAVQRATPKSSAAAPNSFVYDDVWIVEDDGTLTISGLNPFDTDTQTIRFTPNGDGSYTASIATFSFDNTLGTNLNLADDATALQNMLFSFDYFGTAWSDVHINANGIVSFGGALGASGFFDANDWFEPFPKIAAFFVDLDPSCPTGDVYWKSEATRATVTWSAVREFSAGCAGPTNTVQLVLRNDDSFDLTFNGINSTQSADGLSVMVGIHPGGDPALDIMSFSDDLPYTGQIAAGFYEQFFNITNPRVNDVGLIQEFYQNFPDVFFQIVFFTNFVQTMSGFANEHNIKNDVQGIGLGTFDTSALWGSAGVLESRCNMNRLAVWPTDPANRSLGSQNNFLTIMAHETGHRWGAFVCFDDPSQTGNDPGCGSNSSLLLGRSYAHWSYYADVDHSSLEGGNWRFVSGSLFTTPTQIDYFGDIDEYLMGIRTPQEVTPTFYVSSPTNDLLSNRDNGTPLQNATAIGTAVTVAIDDIIAAEGPRVPAESSKDWRQAFVVLLENGTSLSQADLDKIANFRRTWEDYFEASVDGRMTCNTSLAEELPVGVVEGVVKDSDNQPVENVIIQVLERGFSQLAVSGGRYTFRLMPDSLAAPDTACVTLFFLSPGYQPQTLFLCLPYDTTITRDVTLFGAVTGIDDEAPIPVASTFLRPAFPNPFNPQTAVTFVLRDAGPIRLGVYDIKGRLVRMLYDGIETSGEHRIDWNGQNDAGAEVSSGLYFLRLDAASGVQTRKVVFLK